MNSPTISSTQFFPKSLSKLLVIVANSCDTDNAILSPHDLSRLDATNSGDTYADMNFSKDWNNHLPGPLVPSSQEYRRFTSFVTDFIHRDPTHGVLVVASARHFRFYEKWCYQFSATLCSGGSTSPSSSGIFFNNNVHVINSGQTSRETQEPFLRSVQRALRVISAEIVSTTGDDDKSLLLSSPSTICALDVDVICCTSNPETRGWPISEHEQEEKDSHKNILVRFNNYNDELAGICAVGKKICADLLQSATAPAAWGSCFQSVESGCKASMDVLEQVEVHSRLHNNTQMGGTNVSHRNSLRPVYVGRSYARVGLMGNPSDQLHGKSMAVSIKNFWSTVTVTENKRDDEPNEQDLRKIIFVPHLVADDTENYLSIGAVARQVAQDGYSGGIRLLQATCKRLFEYTVRILSSSSSTSSSLEQLTSARKVFEKMSSVGFSIQYDTNVPRQVGLAGSSCIASAALKALLRFYHVHDCPHFLPMALRPTFVLDVESKELGINAGLMDRVAQIFEGLNEMDFTNFAETARLGHAVYIRHPVSCLPRLHLAVALDPSDSGKIHATVRQRFTNGDPEVLDAVKGWVSFVDQAVTAIKDQESGKITPRQSHDVIRNLMNQNFDLRRKIYGDGCLGWKNLKMVEIARRHKAAAKFPGSGGAVLIATHPEETNVEALAAELEGQGFSLVELEFFDPAEETVKNTITLPFA